MIDKELDEKIRIAKYQADKFFSSFKFEPYKKIVFKRIKDRKYDRNISKKIFSNKRFLVSCIAASCIAVFLITIPIYKMLKYVEGHKITDIGTPILQQTISLDNEQNNYLVNYFRLNNPNNNNSLLAILWQPDSMGQYKVIYSSMMEDVDIPNPVTVIDLPEGNSKFALISSRNKEKDFIHYRFVRYRDNSIKTYLEENFVPKGKVEIKNGMLTEERIVTNNYYIQKNGDGIITSKKIERSYIPFVLTDKGNLALPTNHIKLKKGSYLTLLGDINGGQLDIDYDKEILTEVDKVFTNEMVDSYINFEAKKRGFVNLKIIPKNHMECIKELFIEVIE